MNKSKYNSANPLINILSYIFLGCGIIIFSLEIVNFFKSEDYSMVDSSGKYFMITFMLFWYVGLRYMIKKKFNKPGS
ncbi:hypothetical protein [Mongoliibacter ruber]|uniref:Uncharacterized protein n=1 Tax=Mongoliibacter ruber TaxID=1750599 RepID=A0A2T0WVH7_9BACT|nr:hypothetical protein [Mongoliibacter ruber]PRY90696.1 hypothetical protein CLW00_101361 [Mongoliibacter ruber]